MTIVLKHSNVPEKDLGNNNLRKYIIVYRVPNSNNPNRNIVKKAVTRIFAENFKDWQLRTEE
jgi:hypothetical protein